MTDLLKEAGDFPWLLWGIICRCNVLIDIMSYDKELIRHLKQKYEDVYHRYYETIAGHSTKKFPSYQKTKINVDAFIKPIYTLIKSNIDKLDM